MQYSTGSAGTANLPGYETPQEVTFHTFENDHLKVTFYDFGCIIQSLFTKDKNGEFADIALGFNTPQEYLDNYMYYGSVVGRVANRIEAGKFDLNGQTYQLVKNNNNLAHLHGGKIGWGRKIWRLVSIEPEQGKITFGLTSPDNDEGYPGAVEVTCQYSIKNNKLTSKYWAKNLDTQLSTLINLTNHSYFNLSGHKNFDGNLDLHEIRSSANFYTPLTENSMCPTGEIRDVSGSAWDLRNGVVLTQENLAKPGNGYDHNFCFHDQAQNENGSKMRHHFTMTHLKNGRKLIVNSDLPGCQFYSCNFFKGHNGKQGITHPRQSGFALETQDFPDSVNHQGKFPTTTIYGPGEEYNSVTEFVFEN